MRYHGKIGNQFIQLEKPGEPDENGVGLVVWSVLAGALLMLLLCVAAIL
jgi:hypothetical protein